jgi:outer membrane protein assembly factor BamD (BamD/ComL family)
MTRTFVGHSPMTPLSTTAFRFRCLLAATMAVMLHLSATAGPIDKAFEALEMKDYFKAKQLFEKRMGKERLAATFGMCRVFLEQNNPFHNLDSARVYALRAESLFKTASAKERDQVLDHAITEEAIAQLRRTLYDLAMSQVTAANTEDACIRYLERFPESPDKKAVIDLQARIAFDKVKDSGSPEMIGEFLASHPASREAVEAKVLLERAMFDSETADGSVRSFREFIVRHPGSPHRRTAENRVYELSTASGQLTDYEAFITANPTSPHINEAWRKLFALAAEDLRPETLADFMLTYPDYPFMEELKADMDLLSRRLFPAKKGGLWGFIDRQGREAVAFRYQQVAEFSEGLAATQLNGRWGFIDKRGKLAIATDFDEADMFRNGLAIVARAEKFGAINARGEAVVPIRYDELLDFENGLCCIFLGWSVRLCGCKGPRGIAYQVR